MSDKEQQSGITPFREPVLAAEAYLICTPAGRVLYASAALKLMLDENLTGRNLNDFLEDGLAARLVADGQEKRSREFRCQIRGQWFACKSLPWEDGDGLQLLLFPVNGQQKQGGGSADRELFLARELNGELAVMLPTVEALESSASREQLDSLALLRQRVYRLMRLSRNLQDSALAESGEIRASFSQEDLTALCRELLDKAEPYCAARGIVLRRDLPEESLFCRVDVQMVRRMVLNLLSNAMAAQPQGGVITVRLRDNHLDELMITVTDQGCGMDSRRLAALYQKHDRSDLLTRPGMGLGLPLTRAFAEAHGGRLMLMSSGEDSGLLAKIILPRNSGADLDELHSFRVPYGVGIDPVLVELSTVVEPNCFRKKK